MTSSRPDRTKEIAVAPKAQTPPKPVVPDKHPVLDPFLDSIRNEKPAETSEPKVLDFHWHKIGNAGVLRLAEALVSGNCPGNLNIDLTLNEIDAISFEVLLGALTDKKCPANLSINLGRNNIHSSDIKSVVKFIENGKSISGLELNFAENRFLGWLDVKNVREALANAQGSKPVIKFQQALEDKYQEVKKAEQEKLETEKTKSVIGTLNIHAEKAAKEAKDAIPEVKPEDDVKPKTQSKL